MAPADSGLALKGQTKKKNERKLTPWAGIVREPVRQREQASTERPQSLSSRRNPIPANFAAVEEPATHAAPAEAVHYRATRLERASCRIASFPSHTRA